MIELSTQDRLLAIYPQRRGVSFVLLDEDLCLASFGRRWIPQAQQRQCLLAIKDLFERFAPTTVVLEDPSDPDLGRCARIEKLLQATNTWVSKQSCRTELVPRARRRLAMRQRDVSNKDDLALLLAQLYPVLRERVPRRRELWMAESESMGVFDALTLALTVTGVPEAPMEDRLEWLDPAP